MAARRRRAAIRRSSGGDGARRSGRPGVRHRAPRSGRDVHVGTARADGAVQGDVTTAASSAGVVHDRSRRDRRRRSDHAASSPRRARSAARRRSPATWNGKTASTTITVKLKVTDNGDRGADAGATAARAATAASAAKARRRGRPRRRSPCSRARPSPTRPHVPLSVRQDRVAARHPRAAPAVEARRAGRLRRRLHQAQRDPFEYEGFFAKTATPFVHHPDPAAGVEAARSRRTQGEDVTVTLVFAKGGVGLRPDHARSGRSRPAPLKGIVYYNSYGTRLAKNYGGALGRRRQVRRRDARHQGRLDRSRARRRRRPATRASAASVTRSRRTARR